MGSDLDVKISIIVPIYNVEEYLKRCLDSILSQTKIEKEVICVEDCSTDGSRSILCEYQKKNDCIRAIYNETNKGLGESRNIGLNNSNGEYIWFVDSDDWVEPDAIYEIYNILIDNELDMLCFAANQVYESSEIEMKTDYRSNQIVEITSPIKGEEAFVFLYNNGGYDGTAWRKVFRKELIRDMTFTKGVYFEDEMFSIKAMLLANRVMAVSKPYYNYYRHNNSITISHNGYQTMHFISMAYLIQEAAQLIKNYTGCVHKELGCWYTQKCFSLYDICKQIESLDRELLAKHSAMNPIMKLATGALYGGYFPQLLDLCIIKKIRGYDHVLIYGAGKVAKAFNQLLIDRDVKIKGFVVSRKTEESACMNTSIFALDDIPSVYLKGTLMCVMIKNTIEEEKIMCELIKKGFKRDDILLFDELR